MTEDGFVPAVGRNVVFQIAEGEYRPAQIVKLWAEHEPYTANLIVFLDGSNDAGFGGKGDVHTTWATSRYYGPGVGNYQARIPAREPELVAA